MLVIKRYPRQSFTIGPDVRVMIVEVRGDEVVVGIEAPREVAVLRDNALIPVPRPMVKVKEPNDAEGKAGDGADQTPQGPGPRGRGPRP